jgi:hypothetical protein
MPAQTIIGIPTSTLARRETGSITPWVLLTRARAASETESLWHARPRCPTIQVDLREAKNQSSDREASLLVAHGTLKDPSQEEGRRFLWS